MATATWCSTGVGGQGSQTIAVHTRALYSTYMCVLVCCACACVNARVCARMHVRVHVRACVRVHWRVHARALSYFVVSSCLLVDSSPEIDGQVEKTSQGECPSRSLASAALEQSNQSHSPQVPSHRSSSPQPPTSVHPSPLPTTARPHPGAQVHPALHALPLLRRLPGFDPALPAAQQRSRGPAAAAGDCLNSGF